MQDYRYIEVFGLLQKQTNLNLFSCYAFLFLLGICGTLKLELIYNYLFSFLKEGLIYRLVCVTC
jgi:hypothetical protein